MQNYNFLLNKITRFKLGGVSGGTFASMMNRISKGEGKKLLDPYCAVPADLRPAGSQPPDEISFVLLLFFLHSFCDM